MKKALAGLAFSFLPFLGSNSCNYNSITSPEAYAQEATPPIPLHPSYTGFTLGFAVRGHEQYWEQLPLFGPYDSSIQGWWDNAVEEANIAGVQFVAPVTRGCNPCGSQDVSQACPRDLDKLTYAIKRNPELRLKVALFVDTGDAFVIQKNICKRGQYTKSPPFDFADAQGLDEGGWHYFIEQNILQFYNTVPKDLLFTINEKPVIYFWNVDPDLGYVNHEGNLKPFLARVREAVQAKTGADPFIVLDQSWHRYDSTLNASDAEGVNNWFAFPSGCTVREWNGRNFAVSVPGFKDGPLTTYKREIPRRNGESLRECLSDIKKQKTFLTLLEGLTDVEESAGYYRSLHKDWAYPEQYLDIVREHTDSMANVKRNK